MLSKRYVLVSVLATICFLLFLLPPMYDSGTLNPQQLSSDPRENATFVTLARNSDLDGIMGTIRGVEDRFNHRYNYDWVFLNNEEFSDEFIKMTSQIISGEAKYGVIPKEHWSYPDYIDKEKAAEGRKKMEEDGIIYGGSESYRHMCRYESGFFFQHPLMQDYRYYWRVEPDTLLLCDINYDPFKYLRVNNKAYGFTIALYEYMATIPTLWEVTLKFLSSFPEYVHPHNLAKFLSEDGGQNYNRCHFWSNFEIADADFWRGDAYQNYFKFLDRMGGFFYERWGDAPVHSLAAALFLDRDQIHFFEDIGYYHPPYAHVPENFLERGLKCTFPEKRTFDWEGYSCMRHYYSAQDMELPPQVDRIYW
ncbi:Alpha-1,2 mannosyltransferase KTR1 [Wickerhamiella sorbophila]|uniref:Alpha-1,2 mannosyltransferase KTR1 n=1 Tax=Wickerhamiella sorbophila TaxID=45607 RepID=A0A2T0FD67_9ASCO|nr:Alpha-1,2 mannosyltransferase KTR1 [Wickerhamiella sorbophila]PRT52952.1 Alpha-1,2 mannosyltransferase KTR1 [Wickerhamiella sorbophila]